MKTAPKKPIPDDITILVVVVITLALEVEVEVEVLEVSGPKYVNQRYFPLFLPEVPSTEPNTV